MHINKIVVTKNVLIMIFLIGNHAQAADLLTIDAKKNCLNVASGNYIPGGSPVILTTLTKGKYVVEVKSSNVSYGPQGTSLIKAAEIWYGSNMPGSSKWFQSIQIGQPVVIDYNPVYELYAYIPDIYCENNTGATVLSIRKVAP